MSNHSRTVGFAQRHTHITAPRHSGFAAAVLNQPSSISEPNFVLRAGLHSQAVPRRHSQRLASARLVVPWALVADGPSRDGLFLRRPALVLRQRPAAA